MRTSDTLTKFAPAWVAASAAMPGVPRRTKGQVGNQIRFYADLATVIEIVQPILAEHKFGYVQGVGNDERGQPMVTTRLIHESGEWIEDSISMPGGSDAQKIGSALSYGRRYSLMAMLGLAAEDDDGKAASAPRPTAKPKPPANVDPATGELDPNAITPNQLKAMHATFNDAGIKDRDERLDYVRAVVAREVESSKDLTKAEAAKVIDALNVTKAEQ